MKLQPKDAGDDLEMDMSPMIDMVFLLLIFFIVASQIIEEKPDVTVPEAAYAKVPEVVADRLMVSVTKDEVYYFGQNEVTFDELTTQLKREFDADPKLRILIRADGDVPYRVSQKIMAACAQIGAADLIFAAFEE